MRKHPTSQILMAAVVAVWLILSLVVWSWPDQDHSLHERRLLARHPALSLDALSSGQWMESVETYISDQLPGRFAFRTLKAITRFHLLRQKENQGIAMVNGHAVKLEHTIDPSSIDHAIQRFQSLYDRYLAANDHVITFAFIPDKLAFAAADLAYPAPDNAGLLRYLERQLPFASFADLSETLSLDDYYRTDPHWRQEQLLPAAQQLSEALGIADPLSNDWQAITLDRPFYGAYYGQSALPLQPDRLVYLTSPVTEAATVRHAATGDVTPVYDLEKAAGKDPYDLFLSGASPLLTITSPQADTERDLIVFRDSFAGSLIPLLLEGYRTITLVDIRYIASDQLTEHIIFRDQDILFCYSSTILNAAGTLR